MFNAVSSHSSPPQTLLNMGIRKPLRPLICPPSTARCKWQYGITPTVIPSVHCLLHRTSIKAQSSDHQSRGQPQFGLAAIQSTVFGRADQQISTSSAWGIALITVTRNSRWSLLCIVLASDDEDLSGMVCYNKCGNTTPPRSLYCFARTASPKLVRQSPGCPQLRGAQRRQARTPRLIHM